MCSPTAQRFSVWFAGALAATTMVAAVPAGAATPPTRHAGTEPAAASSSRLLAPEPRARQIQAAMNLLDPDGKGYVTRDDFDRGRAFADRLFAALDRNGDGAIERSEFIGAQDGRRAGEFARLDRKKDGRVTADEFRRGWNGDLFNALSHGRGFFTAGDIRPGFSTAAAPPAPPRPAPPPEAQAPRPSSGGECWVPLLSNNGHGWVMVFPWTPLCPPPGTNR